MSAFTQNSESLIGWSRRSMWFTLMFGLYAVVAFGLIAIGDAAGEAGDAMLRIWPVFMIIGAWGARKPAQGVSRRDIAALESDELRQHAMAKSFKYAFFAVIAAQPVLGLVATFGAVRHPSVLMAIGTIGVGLVVSLGTVLWLDR